MVSGFRLYMDYFMKNKNTTQEKNSSDTNFPDPAQLMGEFNVLFLRSEEKFMLFNALLDYEQAEVRLSQIVKSISDTWECLSIYKLRIRGGLFGFDAMEYCSADSLVELERLEEAASKLLEVKEQMKQIILEQGELTSHPLEEDNIPTEAK